jgi:hypothetical protein
VETAGSTNGVNGEPRSSSYEDFMRGGEERKEQERKKHRKKKTDC